MPTVVERGSVDCKPIGNAHRVNKATTRPDTVACGVCAANYELRRTVDTLGCVRYIPPLHKCPVERVWDWRTSRRIQHSATTGRGAVLVWWQRPLLFFLLVLWQAMRDRGTGPPEELSFPPDEAMRIEHTRTIDSHLTWGHGSWLGRAALPGRWWHVRSLILTVYVVVGVRSGGAFGICCSSAVPCTCSNSALAFGGSTEHPAAVVAPDSAAVPNHRSRSPRSDAAGPQMQCS